MTCSAVKPYIILNDGHRIPVVGLGTYGLEAAYEAVKAAIDVGYRHIDSSYFYNTEVEVGQAIKAKIADGTVKREEIFYTGKLWHTCHDPKMVRAAIERSLKDLQLDYMDLFLIHCPVGLKPGDDALPKDENGKYIYDHTDLCDTWKAMEACKDAGLTKSIGVSNFNHKQLDRILNMPGLKHKPVCNQVECHIFLNQSKLLAYCKSKDIVLEAFCVLGSCRDATWYNQNVSYVLEDLVLNEIAKRIGRTPAQVAIRYQLQREIVVLAKSCKPKRIKENFQVFDFELSTEDMKSLDGVNKNMRYMSIDCWRDSPEYPYDEEY